MNNLCLGIDTSAYTTSIAVVDGNGKVLFDSRILLEVGEHNRGLRQQEAVFKHIQNLPTIFSELEQTNLVEKISIVTASSRPRNVEGSYMPVFTVGKGQAYIVSKVLNLPFKQFSHQEGHIGAGIMDSNLKYSNKFLALHLSGGTTELLLVENYYTNYNIEKVGGTLDISVGQLIDRIGVKLNIPFPSGAAMDKLSTNGCVIRGKLPLSTFETWANFSGHENYFNNMINSKEYKVEDIIITLFHTIYMALEKMIINACSEYSLDEVLLVGGVSSNNYIRKKLSNSFNNKGIGLYLPDRSYCTDNALGIAYLGKIKSGHLWGI